MASQQEDYTKIDPPYNGLLERDPQQANNANPQSQDTSSTPSSSGGAAGSGASGGTISAGGTNGSVETQPVKSDGAMGDVWIKNFIRSENWKPKTVGFYIDGQTGYAEFTNVFVSGEIQALTGSIGGWTINNTSISASGIILNSTGSLQSVPFVSGPLGVGWSINGDGTAEFQNVTVRGVIRTSVFEKDTISAVNGQVMVTKADVLAADMTALDSSTVTISGESSFVANEVIRIKDGTDDEWMLVTSAAGAPTYVVTRDLAGAYPADTNPIWKKGTAVVSMGVGTGTKTGFVMIDSSSSNSPFIDVYGRNSNTYSDYTLHGRYGWLKGIVDASVGLNNTDVWGLYTDNAYIKGTIVSISGTIGGFTIGTDYIRDVGNSMGMASTVTGGDDIRFWAGDTFANRATAPFQVYESGAAVFKSIAIGGGAAQYTIGNAGVFTFGDGFDGAFSTVGNATLTSDKYFIDLTINTGHTVDPAGYRIFVSGTLTMLGTAHISGNGNNGGSASGSTPGTGGAGGAALADGYLKGALAGGQGGDSGGHPTGYDGVNTANSIGSNGQNGSYGGTGGGGQAGDQHAGWPGGNGGVATTANVRPYDPWHVKEVMDTTTTGGYLKYDNSGSAGGGGAGGNGSGTIVGPHGGGAGGSAGGSGSGGRIVAIYAKSIVIGASASITSSGGNGGDGFPGQNSPDFGFPAGGGGGGAGGSGGNGGQVIVVYNSLSNSGSIAANGGTFGLGMIGGNGASGGGTGNTGSNGSTGTAGTIRFFQVSL